MIGAKNDNIYFSAAQMEPEMHPLMQMGMSYAPYMMMAGAGYYAMNRKLQGSNMTIFDLAAMRFKTAAARTPAGIANTFRIPEMMSFFTSPELKGMQLETSGVTNRTVGKYFYDAGFFKHEDQVKHLRNIIGEEAYSNISLQLSGDDFRIALEQELDSPRASLVFEELENVFKTDPKTGLVSESFDVKNRRVLTDKVFAYETLNYQPEIFDVLDRSRVDKQLQPIGRAVISNQDLGIDPENVYKMFKDGEAVHATIGFAPSPGNAAQGGIQGLKNRTAVAASYLTFGANRFNKLVKATFEQVPVLGSIAEGTLKASGLNPYTGPVPFYKQFMSLGLKATAVGAAYMGLRTVDHYRRNFGILGHLVASAGVSGLGAVLAERALKGTSYGLDKSLPKKIGLGLFALQMFPGFSQGTTEGLATTLVNADITRSYVGKFTGMSGYRRTLEGLMPGVSSVETGALVGLGLVGASYLGLARNRISKAPLLPASISNRIGFMNQVVMPESSQETLNRKIYEIFQPRATANELVERGGIYSNIDRMLSDPEYERYFNEKVGNKAYSDMSFNQRRKLDSLIQDSHRHLSRAYGVSTDEAKILSRKLYLSTRTEASVEHYDRYMLNNPVNESLVSRLDEIKTRYQGTGPIGKFFETAESLGAKTYHAFFGASLGGETYDTAVKNMGGKTFLRRGGILFAGGLFAQQLLTGGLFGSMEDPSELKEIYEGKKLVEVKRGRFWEGGGTPYSGMETNYFRPHQYHMLMTKSDEKSVWGDEHDVYNPISKFILKNFTYHLEEKNYYDRPYPISAPGLEGLPVIGPLLGATVGSLIKPAKFMHEDEIMQVNELGQVEFAYPEEYGSPVSLGGLPPGKPIAPNSFLHRFGQIQYQQREIEGITGYAKNLMQKVFTGRETIGTMMPVMEDSGRMDSTILNYWDMELGGALFLSEPIRRLLPRPKGEQERYNPIMNSMPSWLPERFKKGDPYRNIPVGHSRLPGEGYKALYPELEGIAMEDYPLVHKYKILADVAPKSSKTFQFRQALLERRAAGATTEYENNLIDQTLEVHQKKLSTIQDFDFHKNAIKIPGLSNIVSSAYKTGETVVRKVAAPAEYLIPGGFRPTQKLLGHTRDAVETYEFDRLYGTPHAFWDAPIRDWIRPSLYSAANMLGYQGKPLHVQRREEVDEHFDKLQFIKFSSLAEKATNPKDRQRYLRMAAKTRTGVNPQGDALSLYMSLPDAEKKYFDAFANAKESDRDRILEMMPEDQAHLYQSIWNRIDTNQMTTLYQGSQAQLNEQEFLAKSAEIQSDMQLPAPDWIGWHKDVDLEDIKLKYIHSLGEDIHDYNKYENSLRRLQRRPYLNNSEDMIYIEGSPDSRNVLKNLQNSKEINTRNMQVYNTNMANTPSYGNLTVNYDRSQDILAQMINFTR